MSFKHSLGLITTIFFFACATPKPEKQLTLREQIEVDTSTAQGLSAQFQKRVQLLKLPKIESFLVKTAVKIAAPMKDVQVERLRVKLYDDTQLPEPRVFSFPGTLVVIPLSLVKKVQFENELAAIIALELANVVNRHLANRITSQADTHPILFGEGSVFDWDRGERSSSIKLAVKLLNDASYDTRGLSSIFSRYAEYYLNSRSDLFKKEVEFNVKEAQRAKSEYVPALKPIVRSERFIQFRKEMDRVK